MRKYELLIVALILGLIAFIFCGCEEPQKTTDPLTLLKPAPKTWTDKYGNDRESQLIYSLMLIDSGSAQDRGRIKRYLVDPNDPNSLGSRVKRLEKEIDECGKIELTGDAQLVIEKVDPNQILLPIVGAPHTGMFLKIDGETGQGYWYDPNEKVKND